uniref:Uncharacterized protein n=1 Tax=Romanomermis culicivorax TaxID=13658 RepID=A0A915J9D4_ROMCU
MSAIPKLEANPELPRDGTTMPLVQKKCRGHRQERVCTRFVAIDRSSKYKDTTMQDKPAIRQKQTVSKRIIVGYMANS